MVSDDPYRLDRFVEAQRTSYDQALSELRRGRKTSHWMWFVFPQLAGLGSSPMAQRYAISGPDEARAYLEHPVLGERLVTCTEAVLGHRDRTAEEILGGIDALKLRSSVTLFGRVAPERTVFAEVLEEFYAGAQDEATLRLLETAR
ncbi:uncharacterized protein (DUF1810 family) [Friedmanniella endophytica]|uniref:Uncharacterized protein (DUF1810 family) n=1 Tax=Microlunatus kandeliicorticis TaxID=1759536 RepID=A0A7W3P545_9ACTN|nr:DUF1810 domain-containing protein [Microlunatus kandeliicorticis]MBA8793576.1 uncharacterized protein (DUF1810 family) [Microlunatus kandeliicorticis]